MLFNSENYRSILKELRPYGATLVAVSKTKSAEAVAALHENGQDDFGENYVQELEEKRNSLPETIRWHFIGHLQSNKVKIIAPYVHLIHAIDSMKLLKEIEKQGRKNSRIIQCLLQVHIAEEESKFGFSFEETRELIQSDEFRNLKFTQTAGLMGMATFTDDENKIRREFRSLRDLYDKLQNDYPEVCKHFNVLSMGMSSDYKIALEEGSNMVRIGTSIFGER
ncbi:MAG: YggS family pyridoxal phosphate-dependent enzyme [Bacteroidetes bacterium]|nr:MAG: YggS family pyridoxal phosphate-dependent enzyme [Bacteroidota bacterium]REJ99750.1 MAG: YggS family pyridoxal phosphate-dependent enzyme [Bacteroidota bacterium]REK34123.1 MAG: YggS family pyridoxal phosphate-dependent enzyme [Bacteroidota bacterium]REK50454.1 MAG: YggS family pyridoxal phosphate-dependent enzyme [Bacteroidota bacterium]